MAVSGGEQIELLTRPSKRSLGDRATLLLVALGLSCAGSGDRTISDEQYVEAMARLMTIREAYLPRDSVRADSARRVALGELDITVEQLREYAIRHGEDPERMAEIWREVLARLTPDSVPVELPPNDDGPDG